MILELGSRLAATYSLVLVYVETNSGIGSPTKRVSMGQWIEQYHFVTTPEQKFRTGQVLLHTGCVYMLGYLIAIVFPRPT
jgi:hypothetical protein